MEKYVDCHNCKEQYDCERTYLGGCTDGKEWEEKPLLEKEDKEFYFSLMTNCEKVIEECPNKDGRRIACEYCRFEQVRKKAVEEYERKLAEDEEFVKRANEEIESLKSKSSFKNSWKNKFFKAQEEVERLNQGYDMLNYESARKEEYIETLKKQVNELLNRRIEPKIFHCHADALENCPKVEQAVKDKTKDILQGLVEKAYSNGCIDLTVNEVKAWFREDCGVEVE